MSQEKLGKAIKLTFQQVQKYERGTNRIGSSRLYQLSQVLDIPVSYFFDDLPTEISGQKTPGLADIKIASFDGDPLVKRETLELVRTYYRITDPSVRKRVFELVKTVAKPAAINKGGASD